MSLEPVIVVGAGLSGLAVALGSAIRGCSVVVLEADDLVGGAAAYSGGQVWVGGNHVAARQGIEDSLDLTERYVRGLSHAHPELLDEEAMKTWLEASPEAVRYWEEVGAIRWTVIPGLVDYHSEVNGALGEGRYLTNEVIDGSVLGAWRDRLRVSPYFPVGTTYAEVMRGTRRVNTNSNDPHGLGVSHRGTEPVKGEGDPLTFGTGVVASFLARVLDEPGVEILTGHRVTDLLTDESGVVGVRASTSSGSREFRGRVVLATSTYDWDRELTEEMTGLTPDNFASIAPNTLRGDGIRLVRAVGGAVAKIPATSVPMLPGWRTADGEIGYGPEFAKPHAIIVDRSGQRFCNDSYWPDLVAAALDPQDPHLPMYLIWDEQHHRDYGLGATPPGGEYPAGLVTSAGTLAELASELGIDAVGLEKTVVEFNAGASVGTDPKFGRGESDYVHRFYGDKAHRPNSVLGAITDAPYHGLRLSFVGTGIGSSGIDTDPIGRVRDEAGRPIRGLYAAGSCVALTAAGSGYNSGFALGRGLTLSYLIAQELGAEPDAS
ncbi:FAD-dependent oxidoreductase [Sphaerimonospora sp. CA-214678]|uniref:FAD-dependent oxidoreductase n=1 Tax=Sphaerimonospora sp. CA-214678 TaxID=3240029 RepID=UPI003D8B0E96